jgi:arylsulfatase A-like enzyme
MSNATQRRPNVVLVLADSMRARHVSSYGYSRRTTPNLDRFAADGVRFQNAFTVAPFTIASTTSILTSTYPSVHGLERYGQRLGDDVVTLPELLQSAGYYTAGFVANPHINPQAGLTRGFADFTDGRAAYKRSKPMSRITAWAESGKALNRRVAQSLRQTAGDDRPFFFFVFYNDSHVPFSGLPRVFLPLVGQKFHTPDFETQFYTDKELERVIELYDESLQRADLRLGQLHAQLLRTAHMTNTIFIIAADHGEGLDRRFERAGHGRLYDNGIRIPFVVSSPLLPDHGRVVDDLVTTLDIAPTICDLAGITPPCQFQGQSLRPLLTGHARVQPATHVISEYHDSRSVRTSDWKLIRRGVGISGQVMPGDPTIELYDLRQDDAEERNVASTYPQITAQLSGILDDFVARTGRSALQPALFAKDDITMERLRGLGYVE